MTLKINAVKLTSFLKQKSLKIALAESCTGGLASSAISEIQGASAVFWGAFVTYTVQAKNSALSVPPGLIAEYGAVSRETACAMAEGALSVSGADAAAAVTGLAGPAGDAAPPLKRPAAKVGDVWIAVCARCGEAGFKTRAALLRLKGGRNAVRKKAAAKLLYLLREALEDEFGRAGAKF
ncbi:MAG: nicotinamide-nucleotide amidohydrolase family protein [Spirochaetaceae bacterium]|jgi:PncC family amidohydrolase|nr:nicotinamide-nucleotide amidohydrolase family protein [Spirochaetaceae bacterium]